MSEQLSRAVAAEIRRLLADRGMSGRELARRTEIPARTIAHKLADRTAFDVDDLQAIATVLEVDVTELLSWARRA